MPKNRILTVFPDPNEQLYVRRLLASEGFGVRGEYAAGSQALRRIHEMGGGIVICSYMLADMTAADLAADLDREDGAFLLVVAQPQMLDYCSDAKVYKLPLPLARAELISSVEMLLRLEDEYLRRTIPARSEAENATLARAKRLLEKVYHLSESDAHHFIQKKSMSDGIKMADAAARVIRAIETAAKKQKQA